MTNRKMTKKSLREDVLRFAAEHYETQPEYPWMPMPNYVVLRHTDNKKWYGLIMDVPKARLGLPGNEIVDILNVKCDPVMSGSLRMNKGFLPAYHMNHNSWITILLDGTVEKEFIFSLLEMSYGLTGTHKKRQPALREKKEWIVPVNPKYYDLQKVFSENDIFLYQLW